MRLGDNTFIYVRHHDIYMQLKKETRAKIDEALRNNDLTEMKKYFYEGEHNLKTWAKYHLFYLSQPEAIQRVIDDMVEILTCCDDEQDISAACSTLDEAFSTMETQ